MTTLAAHARPALFAGTPLRLIVALILLVNGLFPAVWILFTSLKTEAELTQKPISPLPAEPTLQNYLQAFTDQPLHVFLGMTLPGASSIPAVDSAHPRMASAAGVRIVEMVHEDLTPSRILDRASFLNGVVAYMALGGSTNAAVHLIALARRAGVALSLDDMAETAGRVPVCANLFPSGNGLMEDFWFAGGLPALLHKLAHHLDLGRPTVNGRTLGENIAGAECFDDDVIRGENEPVVPLSRGKTLALLRGNLAPRGAVMKSSAADPRLLRHTGPALVFDGPAEMMRAIDDEDLEVTADSVLILRNAGPVGAPGMPEWGNLPIPRKLLRAGVRDMVRICDGRMSGTHYGTCILRVTPEAAVGGPLGLVHTGDLVEVDVPAGRLDMRVSEEELARRRAEFRPAAPLYPRSWVALYQRHVGQADEGCDFDFLDSGEPLPEPAIF